MTCLLKCPQLVSGRHLMPVLSIKDTTKGTNVQVGLIVYWLSWFYTHVEVGEVGEGGDLG